MAIRGALTTVLAVGLAMSPVAAQARVAAPLEDSEQIAANPWIPWLFALAAAIIIIIVIADDEPASP